MTEHKVQSKRCVPCAPRVLLVEDDRAVRSLLALVLAGDGYEVLVAEDGAEALELLRRELARLGPLGTVDLVVTDLRMQTVDGLELVNGLRASGWQTACIIITGFLDEEVQARARRAGVRAVMSKPFSLHRFRQEVRSALIAS